MKENEYIVFKKNEMFHISDSKKKNKIENNIFEKFS